MVSVSSKYVVLLANMIKCLASYGSEEMIRKVMFQLKLRMWAILVYWILVGGMDRKNASKLAV